MTWKEVDQIRARLARGERGDHLAFEYGVQPTTIAKINTGRTWKPESRA